MSLFNEDCKYEDIYEIKQEVVEYNEPIVVDVLLNIKKENMKERKELVNIFV